jgi:GT2 family glycosyltransferase
MEKPLISVIIPNRPTEKNETLPSLKGQTYKNIQIIEIIDRELKGASWARNEGLKQAKGEYIFFCDNDLELESDCLENLYNTLKNNPWAKWAFGRFMIDGREFNRNKGEVPIKKGSKEHVEYFHGISTMSLIDAKAKPRFDEALKRYDDWDLWITLDTAGHKPVFCDKLLFKTVNRPHGISSGNNVEESKAKLYAKHIKTKIADIVIPHHNRHAYLKKVLELIPNTIFNIIVVSGGSFAENCNKGARIAQTDNIIFLNDDTEPDVEVLKKMIADSSDITGVAQFVPDRNQTFYGIGYRGEAMVYLAKEGESVHSPSGYCFKVKRQAWELLGGLDEIFCNGAEDVDFFLKAIENGLSIGYVRQSMIHYLSKSEGRFDHANKNQRVFNKRWPAAKIMNLITNKKSITTMKIKNRVKQDVLYGKTVIKAGEAIEIANEVEASMLLRRFPVQLQRVSVVNEAPIPEEVKAIVEEQASITEEKKPVDEPVNITAAEKPVKKTKKTKKTK